MPNNIISLYRNKLSKEEGTIKKDWGGRLAVALSYPNTYYVGMSSLGFQIVYNLFNRRNDVVAERIFLPEGQEMSLYLQSGKSLLSLETQSPLTRFELLAFSVSFENDYLNILKILEMGKMPIFSSERSETSPFVIVGGVTSFLNPEPLAPFVDFFLMGEAEATIDRFVDLYLEFKADGRGREEISHGLAHYLDFVYVPSLYETAYNEDGTISSFQPKSQAPSKVSAPKQVFENNMPGTSMITSSETEFADKVLVELGRGCGRSCRFCAAGYVYRPPRVNREDALLSCITDVIPKHGQVGLLSAAVSDIPGIEKLTTEILENGAHFSVSSLRADTLSEEMLRNLKRSGQKTIAIAPEAGSERLRKVINKHLDNETIFNGVRLISKTGNFNFRLYFIIGLPTETWEDVFEILDLVKKIKHHIVKESASRGKIGQITLSINCFVPKPFTPFQWRPFEDISELKEKQKWLKKAFSKEGGIKVNFDVPKWAYVQALLSLGDRRVANMLYKVHREGGDWKKALRLSEINPDFFVYRSKDMDEILPWDFLDHGIRKSYLRNELALAMKEAESDICSVGQCIRCGVCIQDGK